MYVDVSKKIQLELLSAHEVYCAQMVLQNMQHNKIALYYE